MSCEYPSVLATKFWGSMGDDPNRGGVSRRWIIAEVEDSLRRPSRSPSAGLLRQLDDDRLRAGGIRVRGGGGREVAERALGTESVESG